MSDEARALPTREQLLAVMSAAIRQGNAQGMCDAMTLLAIVAPKDADLILAALEVRGALLDNRETPDGS